MIHQRAFSKFLSEEVDLSISRREDLDRRVRHIVSLLRNLDSFQRFEKQGSYALGTMIRPLKNHEYDADILLYMRPSPDKEPKTYIREVYRCLRMDNTLVDKVNLGTRNILVDYAGNFHLDLVPCVSQYGQTFIFDRLKNIREVTDGTGYRDWLNEKDKISRGQVKRVTKLLKYLRDHKGNFEVKSILLTTLVGLHVYENEVGSPTYRDTPTALRAISNRIDAFLQSNLRLPAIRNPALRSETFDRRWSQEKYSQFRGMFHVYNNRINKAFDATNHATTVAHWRRLFGKNFG